MVFSMLSSRFQSEDIQGLGRGAVIAFLVAAVVAGGFLLLKGPGGFRNLDEQHKIAQHLANGQGYRTPLSADADAPYTAWIPPVFPYLLDGVFRAFGVHDMWQIGQARPAFRFLDGLMALWYGIFVAGVFVLAHMLFGRATAMLAAAMVCFNPLFFLRLIYIWETFFSLALFVWLIVLAVKMNRSRPTVGGLMALGAGLAILALTNTSYILVSPLLVLLAAWRLSWMAMFKPIAISLLTFLVILAPWTIRNYRVFHQFYLVRAGFPLELWLGNQPGSSGWQNLNNHPSTTPEEGRRMVEMGEVEYFKLCGERFHADYQADPGAFWRRTLRRVGYVFVGPVRGENIKLVEMNSTANLLRVGFDWGLLALGLAGFVLAMRANPRLFWLASITLISMAGYLFTHINYRYAMPARMVVVMFAAFFLAAIWKRLQMRTAT